MHTFYHLLNSQVFSYLPKEYIYTNQITPIGNAVDGKLATIRGIVSKINCMNGKFSVTVQDKTGEIEVIYFNYNNFHKITFRKGHVVTLAGKVKNKTMIHPKIIREIIETSTKGVYSKKINSRKLKTLINKLNDADDPVPKEIREKRGIPSLKETARMLHFPANAEEVKLAKWSMAYRELYSELSTVSRREKIKKNPDLIEIDKVYQFLDNLPFKLTQDQEKAIEEILWDILSEHPMRRILIGDVGSGKTEVAIAACIAGAQVGKVAYLCPTEILAYQTYQRLAKALKGIYSVGIYTADIKKYNHRIIVGTHALLNMKWVGGSRVSLVVIDEQHKFGVSQRNKLISEDTHLLEISATPIPRSYALFLQSITDVSILNDMPYKKLIETHLITNRKEYPELIKKIDEELRKGMQALIIYPSVESEKNGMKPVLKAYSFWVERYGEESVGLLYGSVKDKETILKKFSLGKTKVLISTVAAEVGIDIPKLSICIVTNAERFGLTSLHQIRGRLSRRGQKSYFYLICKNGNSKERIKHLIDNDNGFDIAEIDMQMRGSGKMSGEAQSGHYFKFFSFRDTDIIEMVKEDLHLK